MINVANKETPNRGAISLATPRISSITIFAGRFGELIKWWSNLFRSELLRNNKAEASVRFEDFDFEIKIRYLPNFESGIREKLGYAELDFEVNDLHTLMIHYDKLEENGYKPFRCAKENGYIVYKYQDPDGNRVSLKTKYEVKNGGETIELDFVEFSKLWKQGSGEIDLWKSGAGSNPNFKVEI